MDMPINAAVQCTDGPGGHMTHIILNPVSRTITDLVVREPWLLGGEVVVPVRYIINSTPETVCLRLARRDLAGMQSFLRTLFISPGGDVSPDDRAWIDRPPTTAMLSPYAMIGDEGITISYETTPLDELAMSRRDHVEAADGRVGRIDEFLVNPETMAITHLVMREEHLWGQKDVTIPIVQVDRITEGTVYLWLSKQQIKQLPALKVRRWGW